MKPNLNFLTLIIISALILSCVNSCKKDEDKKDPVVNEETSINPCPGLPSINYEGYTYLTILIGNQCWLTENLRYIPEVTPVDEWGSLVEPQYAVYDYTKQDLFEVRTIENFQTYGVLYNWPAALEACPDGWELPSKEDFEKLISELQGMGGSSFENITPDGKSGFDALMGGNRLADGSFSHLEEYGFWWTSTPYPHILNDVWYFRANNVNKNLLVNYIKKDLAYSVRCIKSQDK